jgi:hypothetical protein
MLLVLREAERRLRVIAGARVDRDTPPGRDEEVARDKCRRVMLVVSAR